MRYLSIFLKKLLIVLFLSISISLMSCKDRGGQLNIGDKAPNFIVDDIAGNKLSLSDFQGKILLLDFWATWCPPCRESIPFLNSLQSQFEAEKFTVLGLSMDSNASKVIAFNKRYPIEYPLLMADSKTARLYSVISLPSMFLIDINGRIVYKQFGLNKEEEKLIESKVKELLKELEGNV